MKKGVIILLLLVSLGVAGFYSYGYISDKNEEQNRKENKLVIDVDKEIVVNLGEDVYNVDAIKKLEKGKIITKKELLDTSKVGETTIELEVEDSFNEKKIYSYKLIVQDTIKPEITFAKNLSTEEGNKINLLKNVKVTDNYDKDLEVTVEGDYDINKPDTYKLYYVAKDSSGNEAREEFTLVVKKKVVVEKPVEEKKPVDNTNTEKKEEPKPEVVEAPTSTDGSFTTSNGHSGVVKNGITYIDGVLIANKTYALPSNYVPSNTRGSLSGAYSEIRKDGIINNAFDAYLQLKEAASAAGYPIEITSGYRSYGYQEALYNKYVRLYGKADADSGSARPGHSEHQTGLAFDLNTIGDSSDNTNTTRWVLNNCYQYGYILRYPKGKNGETGYKYEWWHLRYVGVDLATKLYNGGNWITLENYFGITSQYNY